MALKWICTTDDHTMWTADSGRYIVEFRGLKKTGAPIWRLTWTDAVGERWELKYASLARCRKMAQFIHDHPKGSER